MSIFKLGPARVVCPVCGDYLVFSDSPLGYCSTCGKDAFLHDSAFRSKVELLEGKDKGKTRRLR